MKPQRQPQIRKKKIMVFVLLLCAIAVFSNPQPEIPSVLAVNSCSFSLHEHAFKLNKGIAAEKELNSLLQAELRN